METEVRPRDWIATALAGFFEREGSTMSAEAKGALAADMALAAAGIQGGVDAEAFQTVVFGTKADAPSNLQ